MVKKKKNQSAKNNGNADADFIHVDPARVRFQHSRIRPVFSGCGRSVTETLETIRRREMTPKDLPPIQVLIGPIGEDGQPWYFSLNNRRLWVLKRCREEGLLENNQIRVRVRSPKSSGEESRYTIENCALDAKLMRETSTNTAPKTMEKSSTDDDAQRITALSMESDRPKVDFKDTLSDTPEDESSSDDDSFQEKSNPFSVLL
jgi:hypothetical protein